MRILLFDIDGVVLEPHAYHRAFQKSVAIMGHLLGYRAVHLTPEDIVTFEAAGVFSEWDSSAICAALMLEKLWDRHPALTLPPTPDSPSLPVHDSAPPDFQAFSRSLAQVHLQASPPLERAERLLLDKSRSRTPAQRHTIENILRKARGIDGSLTHRIFQELVLGSRVFAETYGLRPCLDADSYLLRYDRPTLDRTVRERLLKWLADADHRVVLFTSRPSCSPDGCLGTPEAEIGAQTAGLETVPLLGLGGLSWLGARRSRDPGFFLKPSPVHALGALRLALGDPLETALETAAALVLDNQADHTWGALGGAEVHVFEDSVAGLKSMLAARDLLQDIGMPVNAHLLGITDSEAKQRALEAVGATVSPTLSVALQSVPGY